MDKNFIETVLGFDTTTKEGRKAKRKAKRKEKQITLNDRLREQPTINFEQWIEGKDKRLVMRILAGRCLKPCNRECEEFALLILQQLNHCSLVNFTYMMNDREFLLKAARITENPCIVENYFYNYINEYLRKDPAFRLEFLKQVMLNENVYDMKSVNWFVETYGFEKEKAILFADREFYLTLSERLNQSVQLPAYTLSGLNKTALERYKGACETIISSRAKKEDGIKSILDAFTLPMSTELNPAF